jgi:hypothetical protein
LWPPSLDIQEPKILLQKNGHEKGGGNCIIVQMSDSGQGFFLDLLAKVVFGRCLVLFFTLFFLLNWAFQN